MTTEKPVLEFENAHTVDLELSNSDGSNNSTEQNDNEHLENDFASTQTKRRHRRACLLGTLIVLIVAGIVAGIAVSARNRSAETTSSAATSASGAASDADSTKDAPTVHDMCLTSAEESHVATTPQSCYVAPFDPNYEDGLSSYGKDVVVRGDDGNRWAQLANKIHGVGSGDLSGMAISMSCDGTTIAIGSPMNDAGDSDSTQNIGHVRVFRLRRKKSSADPDPAATELQWKQIGDDITGAAARDRFGGAVSMSADGTRIAIGAIHNDVNGISSGHVQVYELKEDTKPKTWVKIGNDIEGYEEKLYFGRSVSLR